MFDSLRCWHSKAAMREDVLCCVQHLSDDDLVARVKLLAQREREATVLLIAHLAVLDERGLYLAEGCASLFTYCTQVLHLAEYAAYNRIEAARATRRCPVILEMLADGSVTLATVRILAPHLTPATHSDLLAAARHKSKREVEELVAHLCPELPVPSSIRRLSTARHEASSATTGHASERGADPDPTSNRLNRPAVTPSVPIQQPRPANVTPLALEQYRVQFTASASTCDKLRLAQDLLRHQIPDGDISEVIDRALRVLLDTLVRQKFAATSRPRERTIDGNGGQNSTSRHIPAEVRRTVWLRDGGRCAFVARIGRRCSERGFLEFHHVVPYAPGGAATPDNIQLRCRAHNRHEAELCFGQNMIATSTLSDPSGDAESLPINRHTTGDSAGSPVGDFVGPPLARAGPR